MPKANIAIIKRPIFDYYVDRCGSDNGHYKDIDL